MERQQVNVALDNEGLVGAVRELFWIYSWLWVRNERDAGTLAAVEAAATGRDWETVRRALSGALPRQTMAERMQEKREQMAREERAEKAAAAAEAAAQEAEAYRRKMHDARRRQATANTAEPAQATHSMSAACRAVEAAALTLGVAADPTHATVRKRFLMRALRKHPDKKDGDAARFRAAREAYEIPWPCGASACASTGAGRADAGTETAASTKTTSWAGLLRATASRPR